MATVNTRSTYKLLSLGVAIALFGLVGCSSPPKNNQPTTLEFHEQIPSRGAPKATIGGAPGR